MISLANQVSDLNIPLFFGGHGGGSSTANVGDSLVIAANHHMNQFAKINLSYNTTSKNIISLQGELIDNLEGGVTPVAIIQDVVDDWDKLIGANNVITYASENIFDNANTGIGNLVTDGFLNYFYEQEKNYSFGITNRGGGFRDYFRSGNITSADVVSVIPFENNLMEISMNGQELVDLYAGTVGSLVYSGLRFDQNAAQFEIVIGDHWELVSLSETYTGVITDYSWYVSYQNQFDVIDTGVHYREAVLSYFSEIPDLVDYVENRFPDNLVSTTAPLESSTSSDDVITSTSITTPQTSSVETTNTPPIDSTTDSNKLNFEIWTMGIIIFYTLNYNRFIMRRKSLN